MEILVAVAFVAGILTILTPCIAPVVPLVLGAASTGGRRRSVGIVVGFGLSFLTVTVLLASLLAGAGLTTDGLRAASAALLVLVGLMVAVPRVAERVGERLSPVAGAGTRLAGMRPGDGLPGGLLLGAAIGLVWAPCVGPIMAGVIAAAAVRGPGLETLLIASAYLVGAAIPLALLAGWAGRADVLARRSRVRRSLGVAMAISALLVLTGRDLALEEGLAAVVPAGLGDAIAGVERQPAIGDGLDALRAAPNATSGLDGSVTPDGTVAPAESTPGESTPGTDPASAALPAPIASTLPDAVALEDLGQAPEFAGIEAWIGSDPLTMASVRGRVVLVEFWTFACINCIHVQPHVTAWYERYASAGLVVVGVHTPELSFERDLANVRDAVAKAGIPYPVAVDPGFATWNAYRNGYWPALYFIDRAGRIRHVHVGEGDYDGSEQVIRELLAAQA
jgi:cytochrome c biogenesis protein CcdA/thiol-disulfide isomerase/thioredoxin